MSTKTIEVLETVIAEQENQIDSLIERISDYEYKDEWNWRQFKKFTEKENLDLPLPRLELRYTFSKYHMIADYGIVYRHFNNDITFIPISSTKISGGISKDKNFLPFRDGAHIYNDMLEFNFRGFIVSEGKVRELSFDDVDDIPYLVQEKIKKKEMS